MHYTDSAKADAQSMVNNFKDEIIEMLRTKGEMSDDYNNDYHNGDAFFHESFVDRDYRPKEAVELLEELSEHKETDSGLWEGYDWERTLATIAAFTYGNAVSYYWRQLVETINEAYNEALEDRQDELNQAAEDENEVLADMAERKGEQLEDWEKIEPDDAELTDEEIWKIVQDCGI